VLTEILRQATIANPNQIAIVYGDLRLSYQKLLEQIESLQAGLESIGIKEGDCIAILLPNCPEFAISFYAANALGSIVLPLNHLFKAEEISYYLNDSGAKAIITDSLRAQTCKEILSKLEVPIEVIVTDEAQPKISRSLSDLMLPTGNRASQAQPQASSVAIYQYSSGSTGRPKRVSRTQQNLLCEVHNFAATAQVNPSDRVLCVVPLYHAHGLGNCLLAATCNGATLVILEPVLKDNVPVEVPFVFRCARVLELIDQEGITIFPAVPYICNALAETPFAPDIHLDKLRLCFSAGNFLGQDIFEKFLQRFNIPVRQLYGCTEAGSVAINLEPDVSTTQRSVGKPLRNNDICILDDYGQALPSGEVGEVVIKSGALTQSYDNMPELNQSAFREGAFFTGDLGKFDDQGRLYITGRKKILIDTGGRKVDPIEVEDILLMHPKVEEAVVVGSQGAHASEIVKAVLVLKSAGTCSDQEIFAHCKQHLAEFKIPKVVEFRDEIPKSPLGKILRKALV
jgi:long-chain acyl-CoA synthetase